MAGVWKSGGGRAVLAVVAASVKPWPRTKSAARAIVNHAGTPAIGAPTYVLLPTAAFVWMMLVGHDALDEHR